MSPLFLYNTLSKRKEEFAPNPTHPDTVTLYSCGPTVYDFAHVGNMRSYVFSDTIKRTLKRLHNLEVKQVINITDVGHLASNADDGEDRMEKAMKREHKTVQEIAQFYTDAFMHDIHLLNLDLEGTVFPRATDYIAEQISLIQKLEKGGHTYATSDGIYFDTSTFPAYGKLGEIDIEGLREGARIGVNAEKRNPTDFALWKFSQGIQASSADAGAHGTTKRAQEWQSPWGIGFPGWHIECSAMSLAVLGYPIDIHTGGIDHIPVHHNNEIAQSECAARESSHSTHDTPFVRYWMHNAFITAQDVKLSKSLRNTHTLADLAARNIPALAYRYWLLTASYRTTANFTWESVGAAATAYEKLARTYAEWHREVEVAAQSGAVSGQNNSSQNSSVNESTGASYLSKFAEAMNNDFNTPAALDILWRTVKDDQLTPATKINLIDSFDQILGLAIAKESIRYATLQESALPPEVQELLNARNTAKAAKNWAEADALRTKITALGYEINDTSHGTELRKMR